MLNRSVTNENDKCDVAGSHLAIVSCYGHWRWNANAFRYSVELDIKPHENKNQSAINFHGRIIAYARSHRIGVGGVEYCCSGHENAVLFYFVHAEVAILIEFKLNWLQWSLLHNNSNNKRKHKQKQKRKESSAWNILGDARIPLTGKKKELTVNTWNLKECMRSIIFVDLLLFIAWCSQYIRDAFTNFVHSISAQIVKQRRKKQHSIIDKEAAKFLKRFQSMVSSENCSFSRQFC